VKTSQGFYQITISLILGALLIPAFGSQAAAADGKRRFPTAAEVSARVLPRHPAPRNETEKRLLDVMKDAFANQSRGMGNVPPEDGRMLRMLTESINAKNVVELGTSNGYSAMWFCLALRSTGGKLTTHELNPDRMTLARKNFKRAGVEDLVTLVPGNAHQTIKKLKGPIDLLLLDAEKEGFTDYLKQLLPLVRTGGLIIAHDSSGESHKMGDYFKAIAANRDLESVFIDPSPWGMVISRKMR